MAIKVEFNGWDIMTCDVPASGITIGSEEFEQLQVAKAWGYRIGLTDRWEDLRVSEKVRLMAFERVVNHMHAVLEHDAARQQRIAAAEARQMQQQQPNA